MSGQISVGDQVKLNAIPDWLVHDLPDDEKREILGFVGKVAVITDIDNYGYFWIGFGEMHEDANSAYYSGHTFCVPREYLELA